MLIRKVYWKLAKVKCRTRIHFVHNPFFMKLTVFKIVAIIFAKACNTKEFWQNEISNEPK